jgi:hypothetical protein
MIGFHIFGNSTYRINVLGYMVKDSGGDKEKKREEIMK